jgi:predicted TIM-barrel fold metal-dependent hydrolase
MYKIKAVPLDAWDTHCHVFENEFPFAAERHFTPALATMEQLQQFHSSIGVSNVCIAHGLSYGSDCTSLLHYLKRYNGKSRGICVLDLETITNATLDEYHTAGIRSVRLNLFYHGATHDLQKQTALLESTASRLAEWRQSKTGQARWSIQIQQPQMDHWCSLRKTAATLPVPLVVDHFALMRGQSMLEEGDLHPIQSNGFKELLGALRDGNVWIKFSAPYRCSNLMHQYEDLREAVLEIVAANSERIIWGSDWPHTQCHSDRAGKDPYATEQFQRIDNQEWIQSLSRWMSENQWRRMWVENARNLYDGHTP